MITEKIRKQKNNQTIFPNATDFSAQFYFNFRNDKIFFLKFYFGRSLPKFIFFHDEEELCDLVFHHKQCMTKLYSRKIQKTSQKVLDKALECTKN